MRRIIRNGPIRLKHLNASGKWPSGNARYYYRPKGQKGIPLPDLDPQSDAFKEAYVAAARGEIETKERVISGTIAAGINAYLSSDIHKSKADSTRALERRFSKEIVQRYGAGTMTTLKTQHIRIALSKFEAHPANNRLRLWRALGRFWVDRGFIENDPARDVRSRQTPKATGATPWTREDFKTFRAFWDLGTPQRLAFELMYQTCAAVVDMVQLGPHNIKGDWIIYYRQKTAAAAVSPLDKHPEWFEPHESLRRCLQTNNQTFLTKRDGQPRSHKSTASWFSLACKEAGLEDRSSHGIRKGRAAMFKENGASPEKRMAILGHETEKETHGYSKSADLILTVES